MSRENLIGGVVLIVVMGLLAVLLLRGGGEDKGGDVKSLEQSGSAQRNSILRPALLPALKPGSKGVLLTTGGSGELAGGITWRYKNSWPNPSLKVSNAEGQTVTLKASGLGRGGTLWMESPQQLTPALATQAARLALNDTRLEIFEAGDKQLMSSRRIVAREVMINGKDLKVSGLFSARLCRKAKSLEPALESACRASLPKQ